MALKIKAVERLVKFDKNSAGTYRYVMQPCIRSLPHTGHSSIVDQGTVL